MHSLVKIRAFSGNSHLKEWKNIPALKTGLSHEARPSDVVLTDMVSEYQLIACKSKGPNNYSQHRDFKKTCLWCLMSILETKRMVGILFSGTSISKGPYLSQVSTGRSAAWRSFIYSCTCKSQYFIYLT